MPNHHDDSLAHMVARIGRWTRDRRDAARTRWQVEPAPEGRAAVGLPAHARTTVDATIRPTGAGRYRRLAWASGEPHLRRDDLGVARTAGMRGRSVPPMADRRSLLYVAHHTDGHVCDAQSPARLEGGETFGWFNPGADGGHRPQETCTAQVLDQLVVATNRVATSPLTGAPMAWCAQTGDNTDNRTEAELAWWLGVLDGTVVTPNTGAAGRYEGVQRSGWRGAWHPDDPSHDIYGRAGFPRLPGFLDAAVAPFQATGLAVPWLAVFGNHDVLYQGTFGPGPTALGDLLAASGAKPRGALGLVRSNVHARLAGTGLDRWEGWGRGPGIQRVTPDPEARRAVALDDFVARLAAHGDHGFTADHVAAGATWWSRPEGDHVWVIGLDTCNHQQGSDGSIGPAQAAWLEAELAAHPDRAVVVLSHHNSWTMDNRHPDAHDPGPRTVGAEVVALLLRHPNVVLWANGHSHEHRILAHRGTTPGSGFWEVDTGSVIDFGQQGRTFELLDNGDGTLSIVVTVLDHAAPPAVHHRADEAWQPVELASMSRELAANDNRWIDPFVLLGGPEDRNVELLVRGPFADARR